MAHIYRNGAEELAEGAPRSEIHPVGGPTPHVTIEHNVLVSPEPPAIYRGTMPLPDQSNSAQNIPGSPRPKKTRRQKIPTSNIILVLIGTAAAIVLYISNIIAVDQLMNDVHQLQAQQQKILMEQEVLKARVSQMSSLERIQKRAEAELGLQTPKQPPIWLEVDLGKIEEVEKALEPRN